VSPLRAPPASFTVRLAAQLPLMSDTGDTTRRASRAGVDRMSLTGSGRIAGRSALRYHRWMQRLRFPMRFLMALLLAVTAVSNAGFASACAQTPANSGGGPCCPMQGHPSPDEPKGCAGVIGRSADCAAVDCALIHCGCFQAASVVQATPFLKTRGGPTAPPLVLVWSIPPVRAHLIPPPSGPPSDFSGLPAGRHTYLATLRLRI
jgi:hypothetical protein